MSLRQNFRCPYHSHLIPSQPLLSPQTEISSSAEVSGQPLGGRLLPFVAGCRIIVVLAARVIHRIRSLINVLLGDFLLAVVATFNFTVTVGEDPAVRRLIEALSVHEKGLGVGCEARTGVMDNFVKGMAWILQSAEFPFAAGLANLFIGLDEVEVNLLGQYTSQMVSRGNDEIRMPNIPQPEQSSCTRKYFFRMGT